MNTFKSINKTSEALFKDKGSKFFGYVFPILSEDEINDIIIELRNNHSKASHFCYAFKIGIDNTTIRANDDGEPSNSAGKPILGQIESNELTNILIVVVRYFGGTKLGIGGLQTAYKTAAKMAIEENTIIEKEVPTFYKLSFPFDQQGLVDHLLKTLDGVILEKEFLQAVSYSCRIPKAHSVEFEERLATIRSIDYAKENSELP